MLFADAPDFWNVTLPGLFQTALLMLTAISGIIASILGWLNKRSIKENTDLTSTAAKVTAEKMDSATKDVKDQAKVVAVVAGRAVAKADEAAAKAEAAANVAEKSTNALIEKTDKLIEKTDANTVALNGRLEQKISLAHETAYHKGLLADDSQLVSRVGALEGRMGNVEKNTDRILAILTPNVKLPEKEAT